jgi:transposase-like protein
MGHIRSDEVVASALKASDRGVSDAENAALHGVAVETIRRWRRLYQRRGLPRGQQHTSAPCPRCTDAPLDAPAYAELLYVELNEHIADLMRRVKTGGRPHTRCMPGCLVTTVSWKHWLCLFPQHGAGRKHERSIVLEPWQREIVQRHPGDFLRGLFHSDGSRTANWARRMVKGQPKRYDYPRWEFVNRSDDILALCTWALDLCQISWRRPRIVCIAVSRRDDVRRLDELIGLKA